ncbi:ABC transporter ATP-binding protein [Allonocardiopsis opalescens]|uniref:Peptide/nickel transport system ATP-binding protein n=1 Tax=Allonocardiopsis opalescens TaxID=1144618 RepID=A0A2T0Q785_9ACTN|nr:ABC transporter ATP-binding protein [Allonocardiopsis opalescens]PRX99697.1 peptide/nickel transport system ATP-binding protein [Allonocardiopsis opalescens]
MSAAPRTTAAGPDGTAAGAPLLRVRDLQIELITDAGVVRAVDGVSFDVHPGETVTIIGESGSGKSTTAMGVLRLLPDELAVVSGEVAVQGRDVVADPRAAAALRGRAVSLIPQDPMTALSPVHSVGRQLLEVVRLRRPGLDRAAARARAVELLDRVRIPEPGRRLRAYPHQLSGGMLQRVLIAMALAGEPALLVADEPTSALDVTVQAGILDLLLELQESTGVGILMITHDLGVARLVSDRVHVMRNGRFVESGEVEQIVGAPAEEYTRSLLRSVPALGGWDGAAGRDEPARPDGDPS